MPRLQPFSAMLLAGGRSQRMGVDKAGVVVEGEPLWVRQIAKLQACGAGEVFISGRKDGPYAGSAFSIVEDLHPGAGPLAGLEAGLRHAGHDLLLVLAVDLIDVPSEFLSELVAKVANSAPGLYPVMGDWFQPLAAVYPRGCLPVVERCLAGCDHSMKNFLRKAGGEGLMVSYAIEAQQQACFRNVNSPADLDARST